MSGHRQYKIVDFRFGQMLLGLREKVGLTQKEVADALAVSRRTIQHWEAGTAFPDTAHLKSLIAYFLQHNAFNQGNEHAEAVALWNQADESAARRRSMFDEAWFRALVGERGVPRGGALAAADLAFTGLVLAPALEAEAAFAAAVPAAAVLAGGLSGCVF
jgi:transcriptional regulator with XRE-family HTH domain